MRLFPRPLEIGDEEGFASEKDIFRRAPLGDGLTNLVSSVSDPTVIAVDGQWGSGKTTFLKMWAGELRKAGFPVVYFDAFENDYVDDAFIAIASEIVSLAQEKRKASTTRGKRFVKKAVGASKVLLRSGLKVSAKLATMGALAAADLEEIAKDLGGEAEKLTDKYLGELLTKQVQAKNALQEFRDALTELPALLAEPEPNEDSAEANPKPLVFIIDELDRCRPTFALEILERIKHFFSVPNVHFVLGVHQAQLQNSVVVAYGPNIDAATYLQKFVHLTLPLADWQRFKHERTVTKFVEYLWKSMDFKPGDQDIVRHATELILHVAEHSSLSLRAIERIMTNLAIALAYTPSNVLRLSPILAGLCILKVTAPDLFVRAKQGRLVYPEVRDALFLEVGDERSTSEWTAKWWKFCTNEPFEGADQFGRDLWQYNIDAIDIVPHTAHAVIDRLQPKM